MHTALLATYTHWTSCEYTGCSFITAYRWATLLHYIIAILTLLKGYPAGNGIFVVDHLLWLNEYPKSCCGDFFYTQVFMLVSNLVSNFIPAKSKANPLFPTKFLSYFIHLKNMLKLNFVLWALMRIFWRWTQGITKSVVCLSIYFSDHLWR